MSNPKVFFIYTNDFGANVFNRSKSNGFNTMSWKIVIGGICSFNELLYFDDKYF